MPLGINRCGDLAHLLGNLGIASQVVDELSIGRAKKPFNDRPIAWFRPGARSLGAGVVGEQGLKVHTAEVRAPIDHQGLRQPSVAPDATAAGPSSLSGSWEDRRSDTRRANGVSTHRS